MANDLKRWLILASLLGTSAAGLADDGPVDRLVTCVSQRLSLDVWRPKLLAVRDAQMASAVAAELAAALEQTSTQLVAIWRESPTSAQGARALDMLRAQGPYAIGPLLKVEGLPAEQVFIPLDLAQSLLGESETALRAELVRSLDDTRPVSDAPKALRVSDEAALLLEALDARAASVSEAARAAMAAREPSVRDEMIAGLRQRAAASPAR